MNNSLTISINFEAYYDAKSTKNVKKRNKTAQKSLGTYGNMNDFNMKNFQNLTLDGWFRRGPVRPWGKVREGGL